MNWQDERWVKLYTRDTGDWLFLSFDAQALFLMLLRKADKSGRVALGKRGLDALPTLLGHTDAASVTRVTEALAALVKDGCVKVEEEALILVNFEQAQETPTSNAERQRRHKEKVKSEAPAGNAVTLPKTRGNDKREREREERDKKSTLSGSPTPADVVFAEWQHVMGQPKALFTGKRRRNVEARLMEGYTHERLIAAVRGCKNSPHHMGKNDRNTKYNDLELICRDATFVEKFEALANGARGPPLAMLKPRKTQEELEAEADKEYEAKAGIGHV